MTLDNSKSQTKLELLDGRSELLHFSQATPTEFIVNDSNFGIRSGVSVDLDIQNVDLVAKSSVLWPEQEIRVRGGVHAQGKSLKATATIPFNKTMKDGVKGESWLFWSIETPVGTLHNKKPIHMTGTIQGLPPKNATLASTDIIPLYDQDDELAGHIYGCLQSN